MCKPHLFFAFACNMFLQFVASLTFTSLVQLLFLVPSIGRDPLAGAVIITACGFYRAYIDAFAYYFFAQCVHRDTSLIGFWVAGLNVTLMVAQLAGNNLMGLLVLRSLDFKSLFGIAGISCAFGIASAWRIYSPSPAPPAPAHAPPAHAPPAHAPLDHAPPAHAPPDHAPPAHAPPDHAPPAPPDHAPPAPPAPYYVYIDYL
jgi:hypothetical protein